MQFLYHKDASKDTLTISGDEYKYLFKVRRVKKGSFVELRNLEDNKIYFYKVLSITKKDATLSLYSYEQKEVLPKRSLTIGWCIIDPKEIEKALPSLNEIGVEKIVFIKCAYSQANFKIKKERLHKILINSSEQCGRSNIVKIEFSNSIKEFLDKYPNSYLLDFSNNHIDNYKDDIETIIIGCEGGISEDERKLFDKEKIIGFNSNLILKSQSASIATASKILL